MSGSAPDKCQPARNLFIAVPAYSGQVSTETCASLCHLVGLLKEAGLKVMTAFANGSCYIESARNDLVQDFLESGYGDMLFLDSDVGFLPETAARMGLATRPFIGAAYPKKEADGVESWPIEFLPGERRTDSEGLIRVKMVPTGLLRLNREVFSHVRAKEYLNPKGRKQRAYFRNDVRECFYGEDVEFCRKWREAGGKVHLIADATLAHWGMKSWVGNIGDSMKAGRV